MPTRTLTLAAFKLALTDPAMRNDLGLQLTDAEVMQILADDQKLSYAYLAWSNSDREPGAMPAVQAGEPAHKQKSPLWLLWAALAVVVAAVTVLFVAQAVTRVLEQQGREDVQRQWGEDERVREYIAVLEADTLVTVDDPDDLQTYRSILMEQCEMRRDGFDDGDVWAATQKEKRELEKTAPGEAAIIDMTERLRIFQASQGFC